MPALPTRGHSPDMNGPQRIVCLTEETTEWLYLLGEEHRIVGISGYTVRPRRARDEKPRVSAFLDGKIDKIVALQPDLVIGFSDMQAALADKLIRAGFPHGGSERLRLRPGRRRAAVADEIIVLFGGVLDRLADLGAVGKGL